MEPVFRVVWTVALVAAVAFASRSTPSDSDPSVEAVQCEVAPPADLTGLEACVARAPRDVELLLELGAAYAGAGRVGDARLAYRRATEIDPRDADARRRLAELDARPDSR